MCNQSDFHSLDQDDTQVRRDMWLIDSFVTPCRVEQYDYERIGSICFVQSETRFSVGYWRESERSLKTIIVNKNPMLSDALCVVCGEFIQRPEGSK